MSDRDPRVQRMIDDPEGYFRDARIKARAEVEEAIKRERAQREPHTYPGWVAAVVCVVLAGVVVVAFVVAWRGAR